MLPLHLLATDKRISTTVTSNKLTWRKAWADYRYWFFSQTWLYVTFG